MFKITVDKFLKLFRGSRNTFTYTLKFSISPVKAAVFCLSSEFLIFLHSQSKSIITLTMNHNTFDKEDEEKYFDEAERANFIKVISSFKNYRKNSIEKINQRLCYMASLPKRQQDLLENYKKTLNACKQCVEQNHRVIEKFLSGVDSLFVNSSKLIWIGFKQQLNTFLFQKVTLKYHHKIANNILKIQTLIKSTSHSSKLFEIGLIQVLRKEINHTSQFSMSYQNTSILNKWKAINLEFQCLELVSLDLFTRSACVDFIVKAMNFHFLC